MVEFWKSLERAMAVGFGYFGVDNSAAHRHKWTAVKFGIVSLAVFMLTLPFAIKKHEATRNGAANPDSTAIVDSTAMQPKIAETDSIRVQGNLKMQKPDTIAVGSSIFMFRTSRDAKLDLAMARMQRREMQQFASARKMPLPRNA